MLSYAVPPLSPGDHTRCIAVSTPSNAAGGIMRFAKVTLSCLSCKAPLASGTKDSLCGHCKSQVGVGGCGGGWV